MLKKFRSLLYILPLCLLVSLTGCTTVPETGRKALILGNPGNDTAMGVSAFEQIKRKYPRSRNSSANAQLQRVGRRIANVVGMPNARWEFVLFEGSTPNAFALPGGKVGIFTGILPITRNDAGLATVVAHEVAHVTLRHGAERASQNTLLQGIGTALGIGLSRSGVSPGVTRTASTAYGLGANLGVALPHSRSQELEADRIGLRYMKRAGYNPREALNFWQRFAAYNARRGSRPEFLSTHPLDSRRIENMRQIIESGNY
ncbi:MAG: M48 family metallopeptidase [Verrucomicrobiota bacterium]|nr:M48 family metallopeptidase [Verrucomicrobiota bacterium]